MKIAVNDREHEVDQDATLASLMTTLQLAERRGVAACLNGAVVSRSTWEQRLLKPGDRVLVIQAAQGG